MKQRIKITINSDHQIYDILNKTYLTGRSREGTAEFTPELISSIKASEDDEDLNQIKRSCMEATATLKGYLAEYLEESNAEGSNVLGWGDKQLVLLMPSNFNTAMTETIALLCHKYISAKVCYDWYILNKPNEAPPYKADAESAYAELRQAVSKRKRPTPPAGFMDLPEVEDPEEEIPEESGTEEGEGSEDGPIAE